MTEIHVGTAYPAAYGRRLHREQGQATSGCCKHLSHPHPPVQMHTGETPWAAWTMFWQLLPRPASDILFSTFSQSYSKEEFLNEPPSSRHHQPAFLPFADANREDARSGSTDEQPWCWRSGQRLIPGLWSQVPWDKLHHNLVLSVTFLSYSCPWSCWFGFVSKTIRVVFTYCFLACLH